MTSAPPPEPAPSSIFKRCDMLASAALMSVGASRTSEPPLLFLGGAAAFLFLGGGLMLFALAVLFPAVFYFFLCRSHRLLPALPPEPLFLFLEGIETALGGTARRGLTSR